MCLKCRACDKSLKLEYEFEECLCLDCIAIALEDIEDDGEELIDDKEDGGEWDLWGED